MSLLSGVKVADDVKESGDTLGGGGYVWESGIYPVLVDLAYVSQSAGGAKGLNLVFKDADNRELKNILWFQSGDAKGNKTYYEKDGVKHNLPGMNQADALALLTTGSHLGDLETEEKVVNVYDFSASAEVATKVEVVPELINQRIDIAVFKQIVDKNAKGDDGVYRPTGETRDENEIDKMFRADDGLTVTELKAGATEAQFKENWATKWTGVTRDRAKGATGTGAVAGAPATGAPQTRSLFPAK